MRSYLVPALLVGALVGCAPSLPPNPTVHEVRWLDQNWESGERYWYHHASQGTSTLPIPYDWFVSLEQPQIWLGAGGPPKFADTTYMSRFGFIPSPANLGNDSHARSHGYRAAVTGGKLASYGQTPDTVNPDGLPVGFARTKVPANPRTGQPQPDQIGLTCAACHTGHLEYKGVSLRVDGASGAVDLNKLTQALGVALFYTDLIPSRFERFARSVLGDKYSPETEARLKTDLSTKIGELKTISDKESEKPGADVAEGFSRIDALTRIGNTVFAEGMVAAPDFDWTSNYEHISAPVKFPQIWYSSWFDWVQYDGSIMQPMVRNAGEAMGVGAAVNMSNPKLPLWRSLVQAATIHDMEQLLSGPNPLDKAHGGKPQGFRGLTAPKWPEDVLGRIDVAKRDRGHALYQELCQSCHLSPASDPSGALWDPKHWRGMPGSTQSYLKVALKEVSDIGTDPAQAHIIPNRKVRLPEYLGVRNLNLKDCSVEDKTVTETLFALALGYSVQATVDTWYDENKVPPEQRERMNGYRPNCLNAALVYKARPLDGVWASPPYLHNGSVPDLFSLLSPVAERPASFCLGNREYDPRRVGYTTDCVEGTFTLDTSQPGNRNTGHEFRDGPQGNGIIGRALSERERWDLLEYLKSI